MVTRKPVGSGVSPARLSAASPTALQELDPGWDTCNDTRQDDHKAPTADDSHAESNTPGPQDAGDLGIGGLSLASPNSTTSNTNPFRQPHSGSITPLPEAADVSIWDDTGNFDVKSSNQEHDGHTQRAAAPGSTIPEPATPTDTTTGGIDAQYPPQTSASKGKAPLVDDLLSDPQTAPPRDTQVDTPRSKADGQRNEVYQIKHIRWQDYNSIENPRSSPILIQNANGPCPLLALVNALSLSTPAELITPFIDTLRTREQISLGLLLDAVFEELMSDRRAGNSPQLPDVGALYAFLVNLHTGMNVNPRFVAVDGTQSALENDEAPTIGTFEDTREMQLYSTFQIPLIHGWIPHRHESAYRAFERTAKTYEDAQNVQFQEEDLEQKLGNEQISSDEQALLEDLKTMRQFFQYWPTQLTAHGLDAIKRVVMPGQINILFRNDHFSMLYKEPNSHRIMSLVTDAGYLTHDEIVWESLVDINGAEGEWFSGDFRSVSHDAPVEDYDQSGWTTVEPRKGLGRRDGPLSASSNDRMRDNALSGTNATGAAGEDLLSSPLHTSKTGRPHGQRERQASEQEDLDLALALQLQDEEEERERAATAKRRAHENRMSQDFIDRQATNAGPSNSSTTSGVRIPPRRSGQPRQAVYRPPDDVDADAPPSYEQAASSAAYHPPRGHPSSEATPRTRSSAYAEREAAAGQNANIPQGRRHMTARQSLSEQISPRPPQRRQARIETGMNSANTGRDFDKCSVM